MDVKLQEIFNEKPGKRRVKNALSLLSKQLEEISSSDFCDTNLKETNVCGQLMEMEKVNADVSADTTPVKDNTKLVDSPSITAEQTTSNRGRKRKQTTRLEVGISKSFESKGGDLKNGSSESLDLASQIAIRRGRKRKQTTELHVEAAIGTKFESNGGDLENGYSELVDSALFTTKQTASRRGGKRKQASQLEVGISKSFESKEGDLENDTSNSELVDYASQKSSRRGRKRTSELHIEAAIGTKSENDGVDLDNGNSELVDPASFTTKQTASRRGGKRKQASQLEVGISKSFESKGGDLENDTSNSELVDPASFTTKHTASRRGGKRKQTTELQTEISKSFESKGSDLESGAVRKCRTKSKSVLDAQKDLLNQELPISVNDKRELCTSTPFVKKTLDRRKQQNGRRGRSSSNISPKFADASIISESTIPSDVSSLDISLPTPFPVSRFHLLEQENASGLDSSLPTPVQSLEFVSSDTSRDKSCVTDSPDSCLAGMDPFDDSDSDEELPLGFTPVKLDRSYSVNDVVWVKWKQWPYLPAVVKQVYKQKKKLTLAVFGKDGFQENFTMSSSNRERILFYWHPKKSDILASAMSLSHDERQKFHEAVAAAEKFLFDVGSQKDDESVDSNMTDEMDNVLEKTDVTEDTDQNKDTMNNITSCESVNLSLNANTTQNKSVTCTSTESSQMPSHDSTTKQKVGDKEKSTNENLCTKGLERSQKRSEQTKPLTDFMKSKAMKVHLRKIYNGELESTLHNTFHTGSKKERLGMKQHGFGPIDDEEQRDTVLNVFLEWLQEMDTKPTDTKINYMFDVWFPEAVVFALKKVKRYSTKRAWIVFEKGVSRTKAEMKNLFPEYTWNVKNRRLRKIRSFVEIDESDLKDLSLLPEGQTKLSEGQA